MLATLRVVDVDVVLEAESAAGGVHGIRVRTLLEPAVFDDLLDADARHELVDADDFEPREGRGIVLPAVVAVERRLVEEEEENGAMFNAVMVSRCMQSIKGSYGRRSESCTLVDGRLSRQARSVEANHHWNV